MSKFQMKYPIKTSFLTPRTGRRPGILVPDGKPRFIVLYDIGNLNSTVANIYNKIKVR